MKAASPHRCICICGWYSARRGARGAGREGLPRNHARHPILLRAQALAQEGRQGGERGGEQGARTKCMGARGQRRGWRCVRAPAPRRASHAVPCGITGGALARCLGTRRLAGALSTRPLRARVAFGCACASGRACRHARGARRVGTHTINAAVPMTLRGPGSGRPGPRGAACGRGKAHHLRSVFRARAGVRAAHALSCRHHGACRSHAC